jgi:hypothetical protein
MSQPSEPTGPVADPSDSKPRSVTVPKSPVADPEAPYGWIKDLKTGETRPKKRPGKQRTTTLPPPKRPATEARSKAAPASSKAKDYREPLMESVEGVWMILAAIPTPDKPAKIAGIDVQALAIRAKAQAAVLEDNAGQVVQAANVVAQHNKQFGRGVEKWVADTGPAWILPAMMAILPFVVQSAQVWRVPVAGDLLELAKRTDAKFDELFKSMTVPGPVQNDIDTLNDLQAEAVANGQHSPTD